MRRRRAISAFLAIVAASTQLALTARADAGACGSVFALTASEDIRIVELASLHLALLSTPETSPERPLLAADFVRKFRQLQSVFGPFLKQRMLDAAQASKPGSSAAEHEANEREEKERQREREHGAIQLAEDVVRVPKVELDSITAEFSGTGDRKEPSGVFWGMDDRYVAFSYKKAGTTRIFDTVSRQYIASDFPHGAISATEPLFVTHLANGKTRVLNFVTGQELGEFDGNMVPDMRSVTSKVVVTQTEPVQWVRHYKLHQPGTGKSIELGAVAVFSSDLSRAMYFDEARKKIVVFDTASWAELKTIDADHVSSLLGPFNANLWFARGSAKFILPVDTATEIPRPDDNLNLRASEGAKYLTYAPKDANAVHILNRTTGVDTAYPGYHHGDFLKGDKYARLYDNVFVTPHEPGAVVDLSTGVAIPLPKDYDQISPDSRFLYKKERLEAGDYKWHLFEIATRKTFEIGPRAGLGFVFVDARYATVNELMTDKIYLVDLEDLMTTSDFQFQASVGEKRAVASPTGRFFVTEDGQDFVLRRLP